MEHQRQSNVLKERFSTRSGPREKLRHRQENGQSELMEGYQDQAKGRIRLESGRYAVNQAVVLR